MFPAQKPWRFRYGKSTADLPELIQAYCCRPRPKPIPLIHGSRLRKSLSYLRDCEAQWAGAAHAADALQATYFRRFLADERKQLADDLLRELDRLIAALDRRFCALWSRSG